MPFHLLRPLDAAQERRYDGPVPLHAPPPASPSPLIERLAAESHRLVAARRLRIKAAQTLTDALLTQRSQALSEYRHQALAGRVLSCPRKHS